VPEEFGDLASTCSCIPTSLGQFEYTPMPP